MQIFDRGKFMKIKMLLFAITVAAIFTANAINAQASETAEELEYTPNFISFRGIISRVEIPETVDVGYTKVILAENSEGSEIAFRITDNTYFVTDKEAEIGAEIIGFYDGRAPMALIYPPQPEASVIAINMEEGKLIMVDRFSENLLSEDGTLRLSIGADTQVILQNNEEFDGELANRALVVIYNAVANGRPAQTTPDKVVVLFERAVHPIHILTDEELAAIENGIGMAEPISPLLTLTNEDLMLLAQSSQNLTVKFEDVELNGPQPFVDDNGVFMLPVRAVAEAMGLHVEWFEDTRTVQVGIGASFIVGYDSYSRARMAPVELGAASIIRDDRAFVPLEFFTVIIGTEVSFEADAINLQLSE